MWGLLFRHMQDTIRERQKEEGWYGKDGSDWGAGF